MDLYEAVETICKDYCKYPDIESGNRLADICDKCPMNKCEDLRWADRKDKPTTQTETQNSNLTFEKRTMLDCYNCCRFTTAECIECHYEPTDEQSGKE